LTCEAYRHDHVQQLLHGLKPQAHFPRMDDLSTGERAEILDRAEATAPGAA
jgi:hypothetical protein